jgi:GcrA cell cycle regulator
MNFNQIIPWTPDQIKTLRRLWALGNTCTQIARVLGTTKNSVAGKVNRLGLPPRPSPIRPGSTL